MSLLARIVRRGGGVLLDLAVGKVFAERDGKPLLTPKPRTRRTLTGAVAGAALTRIATRSAPGAIIVGGGMLAKLLYDRRHAKPRKPVAPAGETGDGDG